MLFQFRYKELDVGFRLVIAGLLCLTFVSSVAADEIRDAVVKIHVTQRRPDFMRPWTKASSKKSTGSGAIISGNRILTNAHVVLYASEIFVQFHQTTDRVPAKVLHHWVGMDMALLELEEPAELEGRPTLEIATGLPRVKDTVNVYGYPMGGDDMAVTEGIISRIEFASYSPSVSGVRIQVDAALNPGNSGGPAIVDGKIVGLVFSGIRTAENIGYLIPAEEVQLFLSDCDDDSLDGKWALYDRLQTTENESLRDRLGLDQTTTGVMIREPYSDENYPLKKWDVITHIGDEPIDNKGKVKVRDDLQLLFQYRVPELTNNGSVQLQIIRDNQPLTVNVPVRHDLERVITPLAGRYPRHFVYGPLVFMPASTELIQQSGTKGLAFFLAMESPLLTRLSDKPAEDGEELVVYRLLTHRAMKGYSTPPYGVVKTLNDEPITNLNELVTRLRDNQDEFITIEPQGRHETLVFKTSDMAATTEDILNDEGIRNQYSEDLEELWEMAAQPPGTDQGTVAK